MAGFLTLPDGRVWAPNNAVFDAAIERIVAALPVSIEGEALAAWLLEQRSLVRGPGMGSVDLRTLTPANQQLLTETMVNVFPAVPLTKLRSVSLLEMLSELIDWFLVDRFQLLGHMIAACRRGDPPGLLNPLMRGLAAPTALRCGPGWED